MPSPIGGDRVKQTAEAEHIGPDYTGDNISAKRAANYSWDGSAWVRSAAGLVPGAFDTIQITQYSANNDPEIVLYKLGGTSGTLIATLTITYDGSNRITSVVRS